MLWWLVILGIFVLVAAGMYVPDWVRWAKWNRRRRKKTPGQARDMRPPVAAPFWSSYAGLPPVGGGSAADDAAECYDGGGLDGGGVDGGGADGGGCG